MYLAGLNPETPPMSYDPPNPVHYGLNDTMSPDEHPILWEPVSVWARLFRQIFHGTNKRVGNRARSFRVLLAGKMWQNRIALNYITVVWQMLLSRATCNEVEIQDRGQTRRKARGSTKK